MSDRVNRWLEKIGLGEHAESFVDNDIDFDLLPRLGTDDLKELGLSVGHRRRFLDAVAKLKEAASEGAGIATPSAPHGEAERRQLTVMFCDLVGSTALSERLDPEDLRDIIHAYQETCRAVVGQYDGFVARYMGDGLLVYFGFPQAHEDDGERAVRTGLGIVTSVNALSPRDGMVLQVRIGIATGLVVAGDIVGEGASEELAVLGDAPNLAARLQGIAAPNSIVISEQTRRLVEGQFVLENLGSQSLRGISTPVSSYRVREVSDAPSRFAAKLARGLTPLVGRKKEIGLLTKRWKQAKDGEGQIVLLCAEPGIGKSRSVQAFRERLEGEFHDSVSCFCSPYRQNSALYPIINHLERVLDFAGDDDSGERLDKLDAFFLALKLPVDTLAPLLADLLSLSDEQRYTPLELSPQELRQQTLDAVLSVFEAIASQAPLLMVIEDVHWIDPSTLELLNLLVERVPSSRILLLVTFRPEFVSPWATHARVTSHTLRRLSRRECGEIVSSILDRPLPAGVIEQIVSKTDGIPLFVEELTKSVLESGLLEVAGDRLEPPGSLLSLAIPESLQDSLMARLDRLGSVKELGQLAATIGRIFSHGLIAAVSPLSPNDLDSGLSRLEDAGLIYRRGAQPNAEYEFKHALVRDAAYESLLKSHRHRLHANIADVLAEYFPSIAENEPELLAQHYSDAGRLAQALDYWRRAGRRAVERSANEEALRHLTKALELLAELPDTAERAACELEVQLNLGTTWMSTKGLGAPEVTRAYTQARALSERVGETTHLFTSTWGLWLNNLQRGQGNTAHELSGQLLIIAKGQCDAALELQAHHAAWTTTLLRGAATACCDHACHGLALYDKELHRTHKFSYGGHDPGVCGGVFRGLALWLLGYPNRAEQSINEAVTLSRELSHPFSAAVGLGFATFIQHFRGEPAAAEAWAKELIAICSDGNFPHFLAQGTILHGWAVAEQGRGKEGIEQLSEGLENLRATGAKMLAPYFLAIVAESYARTGEYAKSARALEEAFESASRSGEIWWTPELHRLRGRLLIATSGDVNEAEVSFREALTIARQQHAKSLELRSATALAQLWRERGKVEDAKTLLGPVCEWFTEGFETTDLKSARALVAELTAN